jgi:AraC-like DNA-binding protein
MRSTRPDPWSLFDLEIPAPGNIEYPLHVGAWDPLVACPLTMDMHQGMEIAIVLHGQVERHFEDVVYTAGPGDVHLCSAWEPHGWRVRKAGAGQVVVIFMAEVIDDRAFANVPWLSFFTVPPAQRPQTTSPAMRKELLALGRRLYREGKERPHEWQVGARLLLHELLLTLHRNWELPHGARTPVAVPASGFGRVMPAIKLVYADPARHLQAGEAAAACGLHRSRFNALFQHTMGVSFQDFCRRARLASVARLLLTTDLPTNIIADRLGFTDGSHLHRTFVRYYGYTPGQYRSQQRA